LFSIRIKEQYQIPHPNRYVIQWTVGCVVKIKGRELRADLQRAASHLRSIAYDFQALKPFRGW